MGNYENYQDLAANIISVYNRRKFVELFCFATHINQLVKLIDNICYARLNMDTNYDGPSHFVHWHENDEM